MHGSPQLRFMARGAILSVAMVALWYWALLNPLVGGLRLSTDFILQLLPGSRAESRIVVDSKGDWTAPLPLGAAGSQTIAWLARNIPAVSRDARIRAINVKVARSTVTLFTLGFPLYWAIVLAAPRSARFWRALTFGTALVAAVALLSCLVQVTQTATKYFQNLPFGVAFAFEVAAYVGRCVAPYIAPIVIAIALLPELRSLVFPWEMEEDRVSAVREGAKGEEKKRARRVR